MIHEVRTKKQYFELAISGAKPFSVRLADRPYNVGDILRKVEIEEIYVGDPKAQFINPFDIKRTPTGRTADFRITYVLKRVPGIESGYCVLGLEPVNRSES